MPAPRTEVAGSAWLGGIAVVGGLTAAGDASTRADFYDDRTNRWRSLPPLPVALHHTAAAVLAGRLFVVGGYAMRDRDWIASARVISLGDGDTVWRDEAPLPAARGAHAVVALDGRLVAAGGVVDGTATGSTAVFDPGIGWRAGPSLATAREHLAATVAGGRAYVIAGRVNGQNFTDVESWDGTEAGGWRREPSLNNSRGGIGADAVGGRPCVAGGEESAGTIGSVECLEGRNWRRVADLAHPRHGLVVAAVGDDLHVIGGGRRPGLTVSGDHEIVEA